MQSSSFPDEIPIELWYVPESTLRKKYLQPRTQSENGDPGAAMRIAIQGEPGSFSHEAAMKLVAGAHRSCSFPPTHSRSREWLRRCRGHSH